jgi:hypothetical protein
VEHAKSLGKDLERAKKELESALRTWEGLADNG